MKSQFALPKLDKTSLKFSNVTYKNQIKIAKTQIKFCVHSVFFISNWLLNWGWGCLFFPKNEAENCLAVAYFFQQDVLEITYTFAFKLLATIFSTDEPLKANKHWILEESSLTFSLGTGIPVGVNILACNGWNLNVKTVLSSLGIHLPDKEKKFTFAIHSHKISTPTGTPVPDEKGKELSSIVSLD